MEKGGSLTLTICTRQTKRKGGESLGSRWNGGSGALRGSLFSAAELAVADELLRKV
jgi:hypothetical protein